LIRFQHFCLTSRLSPIYSTLEDSTKAYFSFYMLLVTRNACLVLRSQKKMTKKMKRMPLLTVQSTRTGKFAKALLSRDVYVIEIKENTSEDQALKITWFDRQTMLQSAAHKGRRKLTRLIY
jgi:hypothetical protein